MLKLKDVIQTHKTAYYNTLNRHENMSQLFTIFKLYALLAPVLGIIITIVIICFCIRMKGLDKLVSLIAMCKSSTELPVDKMNDYWKEEFDVC